MAGHRRQIGAVRQRGSSGRTRPRKVYLVPRNGVDRVGVFHSPVVIIRILYNGDTTGG